MKKVALSLAALALLGAGAFAQTAASAFSVGGYLDVGTNTTIKADSGTSTIVQGDDSGKAGGSYEFKGAYALSDKAGVKFNVRIENLVGTSAVYDAQNAYIWFLYPGVDALKVLAGNVDGSAWAGADDYNINASGGLGLQLQFTPVAGFTFGGQYLGSTAYNGSNPILSVGASYAIDKVATIVAAAKTGRKFDDASETLDVAYVTASVSAIDKLTLTGGFNLENAAANKAAVNTIDVKLGYAVTDAFSATLVAYVYTYGDNVLAADTAKTAALSYKVNPSVSYTIDKVYSVGGGLTYKSGYSVGDSNDKETLIEINPALTVQVDANTKFILTYKFDTKAGDSKPAKDASWSTIVTDFRYSF